MLKQRLIFGTLMTAFFVGLILLDGLLDGSITAPPGGGSVPKGTLFAVFVALMIPAGQYELSKLAAGKAVKLLLPVSIGSSILLATSWYWLRILPVSPLLWLSFVPAFSLLALFLYQAVRYGTDGVLANCGASCFSILYLGLLSAFVVGIRVDFGPWVLLMFVFVVKSADIGAYAIGKCFGKHKFSPRISPGKTWEGMAGAVAAAALVAVCFALSCDIMAWRPAVVFGVCFAFVGQLGDLAESLIKRDAEQKDASNSVPGFGGILDVADSLLVASPFAYLFFYYYL